MAINKEQIGQVNPNGPQSSKSNGGGPFVPEESLCDPRKERIEEWRNAPETILKYKEGKVFDENQNVLYEYPPGNEHYEGARLMILGEEVMDSCQTPWAQETVRRAFEALDPSPRVQKRNVKVLERGFGMGIVAGEFMDELKKRNGAYTVIELNRHVAAFARNTWLSKQRQMERDKATSVLGGSFMESGVTVEFIEGDAFEETKILVEQGRKFDIIASDTYPLTDEERSINDLIDLETLVKCLEPDGVFTFFGYSNSSQSGLNSVQRRIIDIYFRDTHVTHVPVDSPPDYKYFQTPNGPLKELPVVICKSPIL